MAVTYALIDPLMTIARPIAAFISALAAGITENIINPPAPKFMMQPDISCPVDGCCDGIDCTPEEHAHHHSFAEKIRAGIKFAVLDVWGELAGWFVVGLLLAGVITVLVPEYMMIRYLGGGPWSMLIMLGIGIPLYICATASTPVAAALILKGVSPGAALVFLLAGPATNLTSLSIIVGLLGRRATVIYLLTIAVCALLCGLALDQVYTIFGLSAQATAGQAAEIIPLPIKQAGAIILTAISIMPLYRWFTARLRNPDNL